MATLCRSCSAAVVWASVQKGLGRMPLDLEPVLGGNIDLRGGIAYVVTPQPDVKRHVSHFATCAQAAQHRRPRARNR